jgi:hypothetical protein
MTNTPTGRTIDLKAEIALEVEKALIALGGEPATGRTVGFYEVLKAQGANPDLLMIVGSYRDDTMDDAWVLRNLRRWNAQPARTEEVPKP